MTKGEALAGLAGGWQYFAPVPRRSKGNQKWQCADSFDALWVDVDREPDVDPDQLLSETTAQLPENLMPTASVYSGRRGIHLYWKLDGDLPIAEIEGYNKLLADHLQGDHCFSRNQILRNPGTTHQKTGKEVKLLDLSGEISPVSRLCLLGTPEANSGLPKLRANAKLMGRAKEPGSPDWLVASAMLGGWGDPPMIRFDRLMVWQQAYLRKRPKKGWRRGKMTRSEAEASIVYRLVGKDAGASDDQIRAFADDWFAKHLEERPRQGYAYINRTIGSARERHFENGWVTSPLGGWPRKRDATFRVSTVDALEDMLNLAQGQPRADWIREVQGLGVSRSTAYRFAAELERHDLVRIEGRRIVRI